MRRPSRQEIERTLLAGETLSWVGAAGKSESLRLATPAQRRLLKFLLGNSEVMGDTALSQSYVEALWESFSVGSDPSLSTSAPDDNCVIQQNWRIQAIETQNFGGLNAWGHGAFSLNLDTESVVIEGDNGCGKSSLAAAIVWAFKGWRPRDQGSLAGDARQPVVDADGKKIGDWPPLVTYPGHEASLASPPPASVCITLKNNLGDTSVITRTLTSAGASFSGKSIQGIPEVFLTTGLVMPSRLAQIRFGEHQSSLTESVKQLTGLDELANIGSICDGLTHKAGKYRNFSKVQKLEDIKKSFRASLENAGLELKQTGIEMPAFTAEDAKGADGKLVLFGISMRDVSINLSERLATDIRAGIDAAAAKSQTAVLEAIGVAKDRLRSGLDGIPTWLALCELESAITPELKLKLIQAIAAAEVSLAEAREAAKQVKADTRLRLKAVAAEWHLNHGDGGIDNCPLCEQSLRLAPELRAELEKLRAGGLSATKTLQDSILGVVNSLSKLVPDEISTKSQLKSGSPRDRIIADIERQLGKTCSNVQILAGFGVRMSAAIQLAPSADCLATPSQQMVDPAERSVRATIEWIARSFELAEWVGQNREAWNSWWGGLVQQSSPNQMESEISVLEYLDTLASSIQAARPYSAAVEHLRLAVAQGREAVKVAEEQSRRDSVSDALLPLKNLKALSDWVARKAIEDLSGRIQAILNSIHLAESLRFTNADFNKREGVLVRAGFTDQVQVDATLIANSSWLRSVLWAFIFALREEAVEQFGSDPLPIMVFDDPQATFDSAHRLNWAYYVGDMQRGKSKMQVILTTHDKEFLQNLIAGRVEARRAKMLPAHAQAGAAHILVGDVIGRAWRACDADRSNTEVAVEFLGKSRIHIEAMLRCMLSGDGQDVSGESVKALLARIEVHARVGSQPWCRPHFAKLITIFKKPEFQWLQEAHHPTSSLNFAEASAFWLQWPSAEKSLAHCFDDVLERRVVHGTSNVLNFPTPTIEFPDGHSDALKGASFQIIGEAAALTDGRISEGKVSFLEQISGTNIRLGNHSLYRLSKATLEPVAKRGDFLIVRDYGDEPTPNSIVVAAWRDSLVARRYTVSAMHTDLAILIAQSLDPTSIEPPLLASAASITSRAVVGVVYGSGKSINDISDGQEIHECSGDAEVAALLNRCIGLVTVKGSSARPLVLDGQHILIGSSVSHRLGSLDPLNDVPVIAADSDGHYYFKRLRLVNAAEVILESLDGGGEFPPEVLSLGYGSGDRELRDVWPVLGVLFELPGVS